MNVVEYLQKHKGIKFTDQQLKVLNHTDGACLCLAVPGAGKTTTLVARTGKLIFTEGIPSDSILTLTFSKASAKDMKERFNSMFSEIKGLNKINARFSTIHSFAYRVVNKHYRYKELLESKNASISKNALIKNIYKQVTGEYIEEDKFDEVNTAISYVKNKMLDVEKLNDNEIKDICNVDNFREVFLSYEKYKRENGFIDFDDMLTICYEILEKNDSILKRYQKKYQYIQLDEAQDTSTIQFAIVELLARPKNNIFYLGDINQSIYSYRGSDPSYLLSFKNKHPDGTIYLMERNFRSTKDIIEVSNEFIKTNKERYDVNMYTENESYRPISIVNVDDEQKEIEYIIEKIKESNSLRDNAVIYRNNLLSIPLINELYKNNIPFYMKEQNNRFFSHWVLRDILSFIKLALDPNDFESLSNIYYKTNLYIKKQTLYASKELNNGCGCLNAILEIPELEGHIKDRLERFKGNLGILNSAKGTKISSTIFYDMGYIDYLENNSSKLGYSFEHLSSILTVFKMITSDCGNINEVFSKLSTINNLMRSSSENISNNAVTLTTIHGAKGLEWENVYMMSMIEDVFPSKQSVMKSKEGDDSLLEEERRLCYVGLTRGKRYVDLMVLNKKNNMLVASSQFIRELDNIIDGKDPLANNNVKIKRNSIAAKVQLEKGDLINHKKFGIGEIKSIDIDNDLIIIEYATLGLKKFSYSVSVDGILSKV